MKVSTFYILAEPEKLCYPYLSAIESSLQFTDTVIICFAANKDPNSKFRQFEKSSHDAIIDLCSKKNKECIFLYEDAWPDQPSLSYNQLRNFFIGGIQKAIDINSDFFIKVDADNVFPYASGEQFRSLLKDLIKEDYVSFSMPRKTVLNKDIFYVNTNSKDTYGYNLKLLKEKKQDVWMSKDIEEWLKYVPSQLGKDRRIMEGSYIPYNYDCFFFDKKRVVEFFKLSYDLYRFNGRFDKDIRNLSDDEVIAIFSMEKLKKANHSVLHKMDKHFYLEERVLKMDDSVWGYDNFGLSKK